MAHSETFQFENHLDLISTGLKQGTVEWKNARLNTIGGSEIAAITGSSFFENSNSLLRKKLNPRDTFSQNVAYVRGTVFQPLAREYFKRKNSVSVFGFESSLRFPLDHPLRGKVTFSPDGFFYNQATKQQNLVEFKCPYTRDYNKTKPERRHEDQIQTGLHISGLTRGVYVDNCFRLCTIDQLLKNDMSFNPEPNKGRNPPLCRKTPLAWGVCALFIRFGGYEGDRLINLGKDRHRFEEIARCIGERDVWCAHGKMYLGFTKTAVKEEVQRLRLLAKALSKDGATEFSFKGGLPLSFFAWKLLDQSELPVERNEEFLKEI